MKNKSVHTRHAAPVLSLGPFVSTTSARRNGASLSERVYQALKQDIIRGVFQQGEALSEKDLAKRYRGSRTPVREAAVRLQQENLMQIVANRGYFITQITIQNVNETYDFRAAVEGGAAELAAQCNWEQGAIDRRRNWRRPNMAMTIARVTCDS